jgi:hypothetical protein
MDIILGERAKLFDYDIERFTRQGKNKSRYKYLKYLKIDFFFY